MQSGPKFPFINSTSSGHHFRPPPLSIVSSVLLLVCMHGVARYGHRSRSRSCLALPHPPIPRPPKSLWDCSLVRDFYCYYFVYIHTFKWYTYDWLCNYFVYFVDWNVKRDCSSTWLILRSCWTVVLITRLKATFVDSLIFTIIFIPQRSTLGLESSNSLKH